MGKIIAYCGVVCSDCDVYLATINNDDKLRRQLAEKYSDENHTAKPEDFHCKGCFNIDGEGCEVRKCAVNMDVKNCALCNNYNCSKINSHFENSPQSKKILDEIHRMECK